MTMSVKFESFQEKVFRQVLKTTFYWSGWSRCSFWEIIHSSQSFLGITFGTWTENSRLFQENLGDGHQTAIYTPKKKLFKRVCIIYTLILFYICRSGAIKFQLFRDKFRQMHKYCILLVQRNNLGNYVFWNEKTSSNYLGPWTENFRLHGKLSAAGVLELNSVCPRKPIQRSLLL